jgi:hypothetical protein
VVFVGRGDAVVRVKDPPVGLPLMKMACTADVRLEY